MIPPKIIIQLLPQFKNKYLDKLEEFIIDYEDNKHICIRFDMSDYSYIEKEEYPRHVRGFNSLYHTTKLIQTGFSLRVKESNGYLYYLIKDIQNYQGLSGLTRKKRTIWIDDYCHLDPLENFVKPYTRKYGFFESVQLDGGLCLDGELICDNGEVTENITFPYYFYCQGFSFTFIESRLRHIF